MKNLRQILLSLLVFTFITSCNKDENKINDGIKIDKAEISAKWIVTGSSDYESFEFNESGNYIIVMNASRKSTNDQTVFFGTYDIINETTIVLSDFGTITLFSINENAINFSIKLISNSNNEIVVNATKHEEIESSVNTDLLCKTWEMSSLGGTAISNFYVLFSAAGTYFLYSDEDVKQFIGLGTWTWCNTDENKLAFTLEFVLDCDGIEIINDIQITSNSFTGIDMENGTPMEMIMKPAILTKSAPLANQKIGLNILGVEQ